MRLSRFHNLGIRFSNTANLFLSINVLQFSQHPACIELDQMLYSKNLAFRMYVAFGKSLIPSEPNAIFSNRNIPGRIVLGKTRRTCKLLYNAPHPLNTLLLRMYQQLESRLGSSSPVYMLFLRMPRNAGH